MTNETPHGRYSYPGPGEAEGSWNETPERIWAQQEIEITDVVETWEDLPDPDPGAETDDGQRRVFRVVEDKVFARDTGDSWSIIGGIGSPDRPIPEGHYETVHTGAVDDEDDTAIPNIAWINNNVDDGTGMDSHELGGEYHTSDTLSNINGLISDATLDDAGDERPPEEHDHDGEYADAEHDHDSDYAPAGHDHDGEYISGVTLESDDGTVVVNSATGVQAGTDLIFEDNGDGTGTLDYTGSGGGGDGGSKPYSTFVVAASDANSTDNADYVCTGTDDHVTINNALSDLPDYGGRIVFTEGTYDIAGAVDSNIDNVTLSGQGTATRLILNGEDHNILYVSHDDWTIENLALDGDYENNDDGQDREKQNCIFADSSSHFTVRGVRMLNLRYNGIRVRNDSGACEDHHIHDNIIGPSGPATFDSLVDGITYAGRGEDGTTIRGVVIENNTITDVTHHAIELGYVRGFTVANNYIVRSGTDVSPYIGIHDSAYGEDPTASEKTVTGNVCWADGETCRRAIGYNCGSGTVANNVATDFTDSDEVFKISAGGTGYGVGCTVSGNLIVNSDSPGMRVITPHTTVSDNVIRDTTDGIVLETDGEASPDNVTLKGNQLTGYSGSAIVHNAGDEIRYSENQTDDGLITMEEITQSGAVGDGNAGTVYTRELSSSDTLEVWEAGLLLADGQPAPTDLDLVIASFDGEGGVSREDTIIWGDDTNRNDETGSPLASYSPSSSETVGVIVDNGEFNDGTGSTANVTSRLTDVVMR